MPCEGVVVACHHQTMEFLVCTPNRNFKIPSNPRLPIYVSAYVEVHSTLVDEDWGSDWTAIVLPNPDLLETRYIPRIVKDDYFNGIVIVGLV